MSKHCQRFTYRAIYRKLMQMLNANFSSNTARFNKINKLFDVLDDEKHERCKLSTIGGKHE